jgi:hypothetical protein
MTSDYTFPMLLQVLKGESAVTVLCGGLAAQQDGFLLEAFFGEDRFDLPGSDKA